MAEKLTVTLKMAKDTKNTRRYETKDNEFLDTIYLKNKGVEELLGAEKIEVIVKAVD